MTAVWRHVRRGVGVGPCEFAAGLALLEGIGGVPDRVLTEYQPGGSSMPFGRAGDAAWRATLST
jgi:hypothetical protein